MQTTFLDCQPTSHIVVKEGVTPLLENHMVFMLQPSMFLIRNFFSVFVDCKLNRIFILLRKFKCVQLQDINGTQRSHEDL